MNYATFHICMFWSGQLPGIPKGFGLVWVFFEGSLGGLHQQRNFAGKRAPPPPPALSPLSPNTPSLHPPKVGIVVTEKQFFSTHVCVPMLHVVWLVS